MVNEQLARRQGVTTGQSLTMELGSQVFELPVLGIYPDYGRPAGEILLNTSVLPPDFIPGFQSLSISPCSITSTGFRD